MASNGSGSQRLGDGRLGCKARIYAIGVVAKPPKGSMIDIIKVAYIEGYRAGEAADAKETHEKSR